MQALCKQPLHMLRGSKGPLGNGLSCACASSASTCEWRCSWPSWQASCTRYGLDALNLSVLPEPRLCLAVLAGILYKAWLGRLNSQHFSEPRLQLAVLAGILYQVWPGRLCFESFPGA